MGRIYDIGMADVDMTEECHKCGKKFTAFARRGKNVDKPPAFVNPDAPIDWKNKMCAECAINLDESFFSESGRAVLRHYKTIRKNEETLSLANKVIAGEVSGNPDISMILAQAVVSLSSQLAKMKENYQR